MVKVYTEEELGEAIKNEEDTIEIEGSLKDKTIKIRATGNVAWAIAIGGIGIAVYAAIVAIPTGGTSGVVGIVAAPVAVGILGGAVTYTAIGVAIAAGGVGALTKLRSYKEVSRDSNTLILKRK
ncbi:hypothetical protein PE36_09026 [Moritella sp. PE36]|uniref:hypothetical protein n=1 Tax=Moritella sp. PE36 TaxID=58051 RepID=UPI0001569C88|nr:hypothetical protein [Moritella sp. PE36]EDM65436.1 hypothetical protein PE36_09026 [Moritella sp. PE36]